MSSISQQAEVASRARPEMLLVLRLLLIAGALSALALFALEAA
jgi:hypothetical protein